MSWDIEYAKLFENHNDGIRKSLLKKFGLLKEDTRLSYNEPEADKLDPKSLVVVDKELAKPLSVWHTGPLAEVSKLAFKGEHAPIGLLRDAIKQLQKTYDQLSNEKQQGFIDDLIVALDKTIKGNREDNI
ncbi:MAG: hypothetical protein Q8P10_01785 [bacterium]|nr:hypothetical protein [bacterium]